MNKDVVELQAPAIRLLNDLVLAVEEFLRFPSPTRRERISKLGFAGWYAWDCLTILADKDPDYQQVKDRALTGLLGHAGRLGKLAWHYAESLSAIPVTVKDLSDGAAQVRAYLQKNFWIDRRI